MSTFLYLIFVFPASRPSAVLKLIVIVGPRSQMALITSTPPINAATIGMSQTSWGTHARLRPAAARGMSEKSRPPGGSSMARPPPIPDQTRVERHRREHGDHDDRPEGDRSWTG